jgi:hypothetical protein
VSKPWTPFRILDSRQAKESYIPARGTGSGVTLPGDSVPDSPIGDRDPYRRRKPLEHAARCPSPALVQQLNVVVVSWVCSSYGLRQLFALGQKDAPNLLFGADHGLTGSNQGQKGHCAKSRLSQTTYLCSRVTGQVESLIRQDKWRVKLRDFCTIGLG